MDSIESILKKTLAKRGLLKHATAAQVTHIARVWMQENVPIVEGHISIETFVHGVLTIECDHSAIAQECANASDDLYMYLTKNCSVQSLERISIVRC